MKRRAFLKYVMGTMGSAMSMSAVKANTFVGFDPTISGADKTVFGQSIASQLSGANVIKPLPTKCGPNIWSQDLLNKFYRDLVDNMSLSKDLLNGKS